jgi:hypothetical protein
MKKKLYWEDVRVGSEIPPLPKIATRRMLVKWAGAIGDFNPLHYDDDFAASQGVGKSIVHGQLKRAWLVQLITDWIGESGVLRKFSCQFRKTDYPRGMKTIIEPEKGETWWCKGRVSGKYIADGEHWIECEIWVENGKNDKTTFGSAAIVLPQKLSNT